MSEYEEKQGFLAENGPGIALGGSEKEQKVALQVARLVSPVCAAEGLELIQVQYQRESAGRILRLTIDRPGGVTLDDCADLSRQVNDLLEVSLETLGPYSLEVSSPGVERPLVRPEDFGRFKGHRVRIQLGRPWTAAKILPGPCRAWPTEWSN